MQRKTVLITGANTGIGKEAAAALLTRGAEVVIAARNRAKGEAAIEDLERRTGKRAALLDLDLASFASVRAAAAAFLEGWPTLHVLINNAGLMLDERTTTREGFETMFGVNHLGHFLLTELLRDRLVSTARADGEARVVNVSSDAHRVARRGLDWDDLQSERRFRAFDVYGKSKLANIYFTRALARRLAGTGVTTNALHPGVVATEFAGKDDVGPIKASVFKLARPFLKTPAQGAATTVYLASEERLRGVSGKYFANCRERRPTRVARDDAAAERLWSVSEQLVASA